MKQIYADVILVPLTTRICLSRN